MKKRQGLILLSVLIIVTSITLLINKSSYAAEPPQTNYCPEQVILNKTNTVEFIEGIPLPNLEVKEPNGDSLNNSAIIGHRNDTIPDNQILKKEYESETLIGHPIPRFSNNKEENSYYTQLFYWWMRDIDIQVGNLTEEEKEMIRSSPNGKKIVEKIEEYEKYNNWWSSDGDSTPILDDINTNDITYYVTDDYIETSLITPDCTKDYSYMFTDYEVKVNSPIVVVDEAGNVKTSFQRGEGFKIRVPLSEVENGTINMTAEIIGNATFDIWAVYDQYSESGASRGVSEEIFTNCGESKTAQAFQPLQLNHTEQVGTLNIKVIDAETKENLSNAKIVIYDSLGNVVYRKETTDKEISVTLPVGDYTVKQTVTPPNYQARVVEQRVTVTENERAEAVLENTQLVDVPDLGRSTTGIIMIIGGLAIIIGTILIAYILKRTKA